MKGSQSPSLFKREYSINIRIDEEMTMAIEQLALSEFGGSKSKAVRAMIKEYIDNHKTIN